jgi:hypothetical protein
MYIYIYFVYYSAQTWTTHHTPVGVCSSVCSCAHTRYMFVRRVSSWVHIYICSLWGCPRGCIWGPQHVLAKWGCPLLGSRVTQSVVSRACALAPAYGVCSLRRVSSRVHIHVRRLRVSSRGCMWGRLGRHHVHMHVHIGVFRDILYVCMCCEKVCIYRYKYIYYVYLYICHVVFLMFMYIYIYFVYYSGQTWTTHHTPAGVCSSVCSHTHIRYMFDRRVSSWVHIHMHVYVGIFHDIFYVCMYCEKECRHIGIFSQYRQ